MVDRKKKSVEEIPVRYTLLFPDGSISSIEDAEACAFFDRRRSVIGKNGKQTARAEITIEEARKNNLAALLFSDGGLTQVFPDEIPEFFGKRWVISSKGIISAKHALKVNGNGGTGEVTALTLDVNEKVIEKDKLPDKNAIAGIQTNCNSVEKFDGPSNRKLLAAIEKADSDTNRKKTPYSQVVQRGLQAQVGHQTNVGPSSGSKNGNVQLAKNNKNAGRSILNNEYEGLENVSSDNAIGLIVLDNKINEDPNVAQEQNRDDGNGQKKGQVKPKGWASLFGSNRNADMGFKVPEIFDGVTKEGVFLKEEHIQPDELQGLRLVGYFTPRFPGPEALAKVVSTWDCPKCKFYHHRSGWTVFTFDNEMELNRVLECGPYFAFGMTLYVKKMPPFFEFDWVDHTLLPVWVQLPSLPLALWTWPCLGRICTYIGTPQQADEATKVKERLSFARVLVEVDVARKLPSKVPVHLPHKSFMQSVLYEDIPKFCTKCKKMGHDADICTSEKPPEPTLYVSRAARKHQEKFPIRKQTQNEVIDEGWIVQGRRHKLKHGYIRQGTQGRTDTYVSNKELNRINGDKDQMTNDVVDRRMNKGQSFISAGYNQNASMGSGKWAPKGKNNNIVQQGRNGNNKQQQMRTEERFNLRSDFEKELELKRQEEYELHCKRNGFDPLNPGKRTKEWGLCDQDTDEFEPPLDPKEGNEHGNTDVEYVGDSVDEDDSKDDSKEDEVAKQGVELGISVNKESYAEVDNLEIDDNLNDKANKGGKTKSVTWDSSVNSITVENKKDEQETLTKEERRAARRNAKKERKAQAQNKVNGDNVSVLTP